MKPHSKRVIIGELPNVPAVPARPSQTHSIVRVAIVEDDEWLRSSLVSQINGAAGFECLGSFRSAELALQHIPALKPDVVLMDINLPGLDGVQCVRQLKEICPKVQFLMLTVYEESERIFNSLQAGARGYLLKRTAMEELLNAILQVMDGGTPLTDHIARKIVHYFNQLGERASTLESLSPRETKVLEALARGFSYKEAADSLTLSINTIRMNVRHIYHKLHVHSRAEAVAKYLARR
ncbi:MAG: response regulator transcription factor [Verrucomicrobiae bacterium]|nr:response regulator transcription factor [Verrucomicrobiae bacterium]